MEEKKKILDLADALKSEGIPVLFPGDPEYERSIATSNLLYRFTRPGCVVQPLSTPDVQTIVREATALGIGMTIKGGGHSYAGFSTAKNGISLDLGKMNRARLDMKHNPPIMKMQGGAQWGHAYKHLINGKHDGWMVNGGRCPTVGVGGFILGGGLSPFGRSLGLGCDTLLEATLVTADGNAITVSRNDTDPDKRDLFWALCGAGGGNFGVVVEFKLEVKELSGGDGQVVAGRYEWKPKYIKDIAAPRHGVASDDTLATMNAFYSFNWPDNCTIDTSWVSEIGKDLMIRFLIYFDGKETEFDKLIRANDLPDEQKPIPDPDLRRMIIKRTIQEDSTRFLHETLIDQWSDEIVKAFPQNKKYSLYISFVFPNDKSIISEITNIINSEIGFFQERFEGETATVQVTFIHSGGKASEPDPEQTAYPWRSGVFNTYIRLEWEGKWLEYDLRGYLSKFREKLREFTLEKQAAYVNFPFADNIYKNRKEYEDAYYGVNCDRLRRIKKRQDPENYFNWTQGIQRPEDVDDRDTSEEPRLYSLEATEVSFNTLSIATQDIMATDAVEKKDPKKDERLLADSLAREGWKVFDIPPYNPYLSPIGGGLFGLIDLGF